MKHHNLVERFNAGDQRRYAGNHTIIRKQTVMEHSAGVALIIMFFHKGDPFELFRLIKNALRHDLGEGGKWGAGDLPFLVKLLNPKLAKDHRKLEAVALAKIGIVINETELEHDWVKMADDLEAITYMVRQRGAGILNEPEILMQIKAIHKRADRIPQPNLKGEVKDYIKALAVDNAPLPYDPAVIEQAIDSC